MPLRVKRHKGESSQQLLKRFLTRFQNSGIAIDYKRKSVRHRKMNERRKYEFRLYRLKIKQFIEQKMKEGYSLEKALDMAKKYIKYIKYIG